MAPTAPIREGLRCAHEALGIARERGDASLAVRALTAASRVHHQRGDYVSAAQAGLDALEVTDEAAGRATALVHVALALLAVESFDIAARLAERAVAEARRGDDAAIEAEAWLVWGSILVHGDLEAARGKFRRAWSIQRGLGHVLMLKKSLLQLAHGYRDYGRTTMRAGELRRPRRLWRHAVRLYHLALSAGASGVDDALAWSGIAECHCRLGAPRAALEAVREGLELSCRSPNASILANCHLWESHSLKALDKLQAAQQASECARRVAEPLGHDPILADCLRAEATLNDLAGRFETAHELESRAKRALFERAALLTRARGELRELLAQRSQAATGW